MTRHDRRFITGFFVAIFVVFVVAFIAVTVKVAMENPREAALAGIVGIAIPPILYGLGYAGELLLEVSDE